MIQAPFNKIYIPGRVVLLSLILSTLLLRIVFLGYNTLGHGEAEIAQYTSYVIPHLSGHPYFRAAWRLWHIFMLNKNPMFSTIFPINFTLAWFFGVNEWTIRISAVIGGTISAAIIYLLAKRHSDKITAFFALALLAFNPYLIIYNRIAHQDSIQIAAALIGLLFLDSYCRKRKLFFLILSSIFFGFSFLIKMQAAVFISILVFLYFVYFRLKIREICLIIVIAAGFIILLFIDQTKYLFRALLNSVSLAGAGGGRLLALRTMTLFYVKAHIKYFELTALPLMVCLAFWRKIDNKLFKLLVTFSVIYFIAIILQNRPFFRYLQAGIITISCALAFPLRRFAVKKYYYSGFIALIILLSWSLFIHRSYVSSIYRHIPYKYIAKRANELRGDGRILIYGRNSETEHYLSPTGNYGLDESVDPYQARTPQLVSNYKVMFDSVRKIPPIESTLFDPEIVRRGDVLVVTGMQMVGGEPAPHLRGYDGKGFRIYRHGLETPREFYKTFMTNEKMRDNFVIVEKIYLTNDSDELAALILKKR